MEAMMLIGDSEDIKYTTGLENPEKNLVSDSMLAKIKQEMQNNTDEDKQEQEEKVEVTVDDEPKGLMSRKK